MGKKERNEKGTRSFDTEIDTTLWAAPGAVDSQLSSPLYGSIPAEIRTLIFELVLEDKILSTAFSTHDFRVRSDHDVIDGEDIRDAGDENAAPVIGQFWDDGSSLGGWSPDRPDSHPKHWARPDVKGPIAQPPLLQALCRRAYLELHKGSTRLRTYRVFGKAPGQPGPGMSRAPEEIRPARCRIYSPMWWLAEEFPRRCDTDPRLSRVQDLRLTIRQRDWWFGNQTLPLHIDPFSGQNRIPGWRHDQAAEAMRRDMEQVPAERTGFLPSKGGEAGKPEPALPFLERQWGMAFRSLPRLERLTIDFETREDQREELSRIVDWAVRAWRFPLTESWPPLASSSSPENVPDLSTSSTKSCRYLVAGEDVRLSSWRGLPWDFSLNCPDCHRTYCHDSYYRFVSNRAQRQRGGGDSPPAVETEDTSSCSECERKLGLMRRGFGPRMFVWTVTWTPRVDESLEFVQDGWWRSKKEEITVWQRGGAVWGFREKIKE